MYGGMQPYTCPGSLLFLAHKSLRFSRIPTLQTQILTPVQDRNFVQANPYACTGSQQFTPLLPPGQAPNASHANPYACTGSQQFKKFLTPVQAFNASHANPYACIGSQ
ncbi:hypothetical protein O181_131251 [Austropuccinia psidii MF-1]|uniref:Uncharacterized protein n=1 Tax=Austropuccinia psidii MF-1 TaxID=1389203 RepID=A0A9Q3L4A8_9BASI|nr:hypothetical protein [Austropuccinia psidii MF-1]